LNRCGANYDKLTDRADIRSSGGVPPDIGIVN
jgi:hypothetical protein